MHSELDITRIAALDALQQNVLPYKTLNLSPVSPVETIFWDNSIMQSLITLSEIESAINFWRQRSPSVGEELRLCREASTLATPYARMIIEHRQSLPTSELSDTARQALTDWQTAINQ